MGEIMSRMLHGLRYSLYVVFHPFKGFWDLKHEKKGNVFSAWVLVASLILLYILRRQMTGFILNFNILNEMNIFVEILSVLVPLGLWCLSNWCITTLVDGEGSFRDIFVTTAYALVPLIIIEEEVSFYVALDVLSILWTALLLLIGIMTVHQFSMSKTIFTVLIAIVGMVIMLFLFLLFVSIVQQLKSFIDLLWTELSMRM